MEPRALSSGNIAGGSPGEVATAADQPKRTPSLVPPTSSMTRNSGITL